MQNSLFVGRQAQLDQLKSHWQEAFHKKQGKVVFLIGEAGIGKTSLVEQFSRSVLANYSRVQVAYAQCDQVAGDISPYAPFVQILNSLTEQAAKRGENWFVEYMREVGPDVLGMVPVAGSLLAAAAKSVDFVWQRRKQGRTAETDRSQFGQQDLFQQFTDTFRNLAANKNPLLLCIDDWHWADTSSTNLLFHLARQLSDVPLLLLATYRPHDAEAREHPILAVKTEMERYSLCASLELDFLSRAEVESYLAQRFPEAHFAPDFIDWLLKTTSGNALFISEYLSLLVNEGLLTPAGALTGELADLKPPPNVEAVIRTRLGFLDREARDMLAYGSVEGEQFTTLVLSRLLDIKPLSLLRKLRAIEETHHLIASLGQQSIYDQQTTVYRFVHALIYRTLYNMLEAEERIEISRLLLGILEETYDQVDETTKYSLLPELINHAAETGDHLAEARYALAAGKIAATNYAHNEVLLHCTIGLGALNKIAKETTDLRALRLDLLLRQGHTQYIIGAYKQALETYHTAEVLIEETTDDKIKLIEEVWIPLGRTLRTLGHYDQALNYFEKSVALAEQTEDKPELIVTCYRGFGDIFWKLSDYDSALIWHQKALAISEDLGHKPGIAFSCSMIGTIFDKQGEFNQALEWHFRAMEINTEIGNEGALGWCFNNVGDVYQGLGEYELALKFYHQALTTWQHLGYKRNEAIAIDNIGRVYQNQGQNNQGLEAFQKALIIREELDDKPEMAWSFTHIGRTLYEQGNYDQSSELFLKAINLFEELGNKSGVAWNFNNLALLLRDQGHNSQAYDFWLKALDIWQKSGEKQREAIAIYNIGTIYEAQSKHSEALAHYHQALSIREKLGNPDEITETRQRIAEVETKLAAQENKT